MADRPLCSNVILLLFSSSLLNHNLLDTQTETPTPTCCRLRAVLIPALCACQVFPQENWVVLHVYTTDNYNPYKRMLFLHFWVLLVVKLVTVIPSVFNPSSLSEFPLLSFLFIYPFIFKFCVSAHCVACACMHMIAQKCEHTGFRYFCPEEVLWACER